MQQDTNASIRTMSGLNFLVGIWLIISPYILSYSTAQAQWEQTVFGALIALMAGVRFLAPSQLWSSWVSALSGAWLIIAPFVTGYQASVAYWNEVIFGVIVVLIAVSNGLTRSADTRHHHPAM